MGVEMEAKKRRRSRLVVVVDINPILGKANWGQRCRQVVGVQMCVNKILASFRGLSPSSAGATGFQWGFKFIDTSLTSMASQRSIQRRVDTWRATCGWSGGGGGGGSGHSLRPDVLRQSFRLADASSYEAFCSVLDLLIGQCSGSEYGSNDRSGVDAPSSYVTRGRSIARALSEVISDFSWETVGLEEENEEGDEEEEEESEGEEGGRWEDGEEAVTGRAGDDKDQDKVRRSWQGGGYNDCVSRYNDCVSNSVLSNDDDMEAGCTQSHATGAAANKGGQRRRRSGQGICSAGNYIVLFSAAPIDTVDEVASFVGMPAQQYEADSPWNEVQRSLSAGGKLGPSLLDLCQEPFTPLKGQFDLQRVRLCWVDVLQSSSGNNSSSFPSVCDKQRFATAPSTSYVAAHVAIACLRGSVMPLDLLVGGASIIPFSTLFFSLARKGCPWERQGGKRGGVHDTDVQNAVRRPRGHRGCVDEEGSTTLVLLSLPNPYIALPSQGGERGKTGGTTYSLCFLELVPCLKIASSSHRRRTAEGGRGESPQPQADRAQSPLLLPSTPSSATAHGVAVIDQLLLGSRLILMNVRCLLRRSLLLPAWLVADRQYIVTSTHVRRVKVAPDDDGHVGGGTPGCCGHVGCCPINGVTTGNNDCRKAGARKDAEKAEQRFRRFLLCLSKRMAVAVVDFGDESGVVISGVLEPITPSVGILTLLADDVSLDATKVMERKMPFPLCNSVADKEEGGTGRERCCRNRLPPDPLAMESLQPGKPVLNGDGNNTRHHHHHLSPSDGERADGAGRCGGMAGLCSVDNGNGGCGNQRGPSTKRTWGTMMAEGDLGEEGGEWGGATTFSGCGSDRLLRVVDRGLPPAKRRMSDGLASEDRGQCPASVGLLRETTPAPARKSGRAHRFPFCCSGPEDDHDHDHDHGLLHCLQRDRCTMHVEQFSKDPDRVWLRYVYLPPLYSVKGAVAGWDRERLQAGVAAGDRGEKQAFPDLVDGHAKTGTRALTPLTSPNNIRGEGRCALASLTAQGRYVGDSGRQAQAGGGVDDRAGVPREVSPRQENRKDGERNGGGHCGRVVGSLLPLVEAKSVRVNGARTGVPSAGLGRQVVGGAVEGNGGKGEEGGTGKSVKGNKTGDVVANSYSLSALSKRGKGGTHHLEPWYLQKSRLNLKMRKGVRYWLGLHVKEAMKREGAEKRSDGDGGGRHGEGDPETTGKGGGVERKTWFAGDDGEGDERSFRLAVASQLVQLKNEWGQQKWQGQHKTESQEKRAKVVDDSLTEKAEEMGRERERSGKQQQQQQQQTECDKSAEEKDVCRRGTKSTKGAVAGDTWADCSGCGKGEDSGRGDDLKEEIAVLVESVNSFPAKGEVEGDAVDFASMVVSELLRIMPLVMAKTAKASSHNCVRGEGKETGGKQGGDGGGSVLHEGDGTEECTAPRKVRHVSKQDEEVGLGEDRNRSENGNSVAAAIDRRALLKRMARMLLLKPKQLAKMFKFVSLPQGRTKLGLPTATVEEKLRSHQLQIFLRLEMMGPDNEIPANDQLKESLWKEVCQLLLQIRHNLPNEEDLQDYCDRVIYARYGASLGGTLEKMYWEMEFKVSNDADAEAEALGGNVGDDGMMSGNDKQPGPESSSRARQRRGRNRQGAKSGSEGDVNSSSWGDRRSRGRSSSLLRSLKGRCRLERRGTARALGWNGKKGENAERERKMSHFYVADQDRLRRVKTVKKIMSRVGDKGREKGRLTRVNMRRRQNGHAGREGPPQEVSSSADVVAATPGPSRSSREVVRGTPSLETGTRRRFTPICIGRRRSGSCSIGSGRARSWGRSRGTPSVSVRGTPSTGTGGVVSGECVQQRTGYCRPGMGVESQCRAEPELSRETAERRAALLGNGRSGGRRGLRQKFRDVTMRLKTQLESNSVGAADSAMVAGTSTPGAVNGHAAEPVGGSLNPNAAVTKSSSEKRMAASIMWPVGIPGDEEDEEDGDDEGVAVTKTPCKTFGPGAGNRGSDGRKVVNVAVMNGDGVRGTGTGQQAGGLEPGQGKVQPSCSQRPEETSLQHREEDGGERDTSLHNGSTEVVGGVQNSKDFARDASTMMEGEVRRQDSAEQKNPNSFIATADAGEDRSTCSSPAALATECGINSSPGKEVLLKSQVSHHHAFARIEVTGKGAPAAQGKLLEHSTREGGETGAGKAQANYNDGNDTLVGKKRKRGRPRTSGLAGAGACGANEHRNQDCQTLANQESQLVGIGTEAESARNKAKRGRKKMSSIAVQGSNCGHQGAAVQTENPGLSSADVTVVPEKPDSLCKTDQGKNFHSTPNLEPREGLRSAERDAALINADGASAEEDAAVGVTENKAVKGIGAVHGRKSKGSTQRSVCGTATACREGEAATRPKRKRRRNL
ncbi:hypothetical protein CBR_g41297 [Chara braunii]|uniref:Uncharacterized protein n=1 Tax=Chara braunii TaxID=69332 RepID=A0A388LVN0_CHABU|nr:hypothetical protein CBR_g41297 [Chara braunii]|eukprot:GBG86303.1 hypothetical protein CBR_g41297 [Chara braunii]